MDTPEPIIELEPPTIVNTDDAVSVKLPFVNVGSAPTSDADKFTLFILYFCPDGILTDPLSSIVIDEFCINFPVIPSNLTIALSVELAEPKTAPFKLTCKISQ